MTDKKEYERLWDDSAMGRMGCGCPVVAVIIIAVLMLCSCATKTVVEYRDRDVVKYNTVYVHDTLMQHVHDSVYHTVFQKGDTIYDTKYVEKTRWKERFVYKTDTCYKDSILIHKVYTTTEKRVIPKWCYFSLVVWLILFIFAIVKIKKWIG